MKLPLQNKSIGFACFNASDNSLNARSALLNNLSNLPINNSLFFKKITVFEEIYLRKLSRFS